MKRNEKGQFIKGSNGNTFEGFGIWYDKKGYPTIWINNKSVKIHVYIWERINGEKPKGHDIHHKDFDKGNYKLSNLEILSQSDHKKLHAGWIREKGVWMKKPCKDCKRNLPLDKFYPRKGMTPSNLCIKCTLKMCKNKLINDMKYREQKKLYLRNYYRRKNGKT